MGASAVEAARACEYVGAGTVEFLLAEDGSYYFLEMNTRLQVEHPVTEMLYNVDLVSWQIDVAEGKALPLDQEALDARRAGAAIECRIYAEDSERFLPSPGTITHLRVPHGPYVRNDSGVYEGSEITMYYDPMISKLIVWGEDRTQALARMRRALDEYAVHGIRTNLPFHRRILRHEPFCSGTYDTGLIERERASLMTKSASSRDVEIGLAASAIARASRTAKRTPGGEPNGDSRGDSTAISAWRAGRRGWRGRL